ncbi:MAG TPA: cupin domain-containing protein, partial [Paenirhodobacter sp.]
GNRIRAIRRDLALSLQQVSERAGVSVGTLSQLERGLSQPSLRTLQRICNAFGVPLAWLFQTAGDPQGEEINSYVVRANRGARLYCPAEGYDKFLLSPQSLDGLQMILVRLAPHAQSGSEAYTHPGLDGGFVLNGSLHLEIGEQLNVLTAGDSFAFPSTTPHRFENRGATTAEIIWVTTQSAQGEH